MILIISNILTTINDFATPFLFRLEIFRYDFHVTSTKIAYVNSLNSFNTEFGVNIVSWSFEFFE